MTITTHDNTPDKNKEKNLLSWKTKIMKSQVTN